MSESEKKEALFEYVKNYIKENEVLSGESIFQCDHHIIGAPNFMDKCCEIVGFHELED